MTILSIPVWLGVAPGCGSVEDSGGDVGGGADAGDGPGDPADAAPDAAPGALCTANEFIECADDTTAVHCNDRGTEHVTVECASTECRPDQNGCFCEPDSSTCSDDQAVFCDANGEVSRIDACALGCNAAGERCVDVDPSNELGGFLDMAYEAPAVVLTSGATVDTDTGVIENGDGTPVDVPSFQVTAPPEGVAIRVFAVNSLTIGDTTVSGARALAIVSHGDILVNGHVRVLAGALSTGSCVGGSAGCDGPPGSFAGVCAGAGGGGSGGAGGRGGSATATSPSQGTFSEAGGSGGGVAGSAALIPLRGGCKGGGDQNNPDQGANGGGAIQLVSRTVVSFDQAGVDPFIDVGGLGATSGVGSGGGSGGGVLVEAPRVVVPGGTGMVANGGSGNCVDTDGRDGRLSTGPAAGGACPEPSQGDGGNGSSLASSTGSNGESINSPVLTTLYTGGGGGGGAGRIRVNVPTGPDFSDFGTVSPAASVGTLQTR